MPKSAGGGGGANLFTSNLTGDGIVGSSQYIDLGVIPINYKIWFGTAQYASPDKSITFEIRTSNSGQSSGADNSTTVLASAAVSPRSGMLTKDMYKNGRLHIVSVIGTGSEHFWLKLKSKSGTAGSYYYSINYTTE